MNPYLEVSGLDSNTCAKLLGYSPRLFREWATGQRPIPPSVANHISSVLGVGADALMNPPHQPVDAATIEPAVWFKLRSQGLKEADRELVLLIRQLGTFYEELEQVRSQGSLSWKVIFEQIRNENDPQAPPREQGRVAAKRFRGLRELNKGRMGIGELVRSSLRNLGILIVESPIKASLIEGCAFPAGSSQRPCIFANIHGTTWFRRNAIIMHELAHLIFDLSSEGAALDVYASKPKNETSSCQSLAEALDADRKTTSNETSEARAEAFAQEATVPREVLLHVAQRHGISWDAPMTAIELAQIVADVHVEVRLIVRAAIEYGLIDRDGGESLIRLPIYDHLKQISDHALSGKEYLAKVGQAAEAWTGKRNTSVPSRTLRLPVNYVKNVVEAYEERLISIGRAAELLMVSEDIFADRFDKPLAAD
jgi:Zn-dependent peptidase ImmA (M78 family)